MDRTPGPITLPVTSVEVAREYLTLTQRARLEGIDDREEAHRQSLRGTLVELGEKISPTPPEGDRRQHTRVPLRLALWYQSTSEFARAFAVSLGLGGVMLHTKNPYPTGTDLTIEFQASPVGRVRAQVVWSSETAMGLKFLGLEQEQKNEIIEIIFWALAERLLVLSPAWGGKPRPPKVGPLPPKPIGGFNRPPPLPENRLDADVGSIEPMVDTETNSSPMAGPTAPKSDATKH